MERDAPWPLVPKPFRDELLSSWVTRTALAHYVEVYELLSKYFSRDKIYAKEMETYPFPKVTFEKLSHFSGVSEKKLHSMQLYWAEGKLLDRIEPSNRYGWIIRYSGRGDLSKRKSGALRYCPVCLEDEGYYKQEWKLLFVNVCRHHGIYLLDRCQRCGSVVVPQRVEPPHRIETCFKCHANLCKAVTEKARQKDIEAVGTCIGILKSGGVIMGEEIATTLEFFDALRDVCRNLLRLFPEEEVFMGIAGTNKKAFEKKVYLEQYPPEQIALIVTAAVELLTKNWPDDFISFLLRNRLHYASLFKNKRKKGQREKLPGWLQKCFHPWKSSPEETRAPSAGYPSASGR